jgi:repressor LexA
MATKRKLQKPPPVAPTEKRASTPVVPFFRICPIKVIDNCSNGQYGVYDENGKEARRGRRDGFVKLRKHVMKAQLTDKQRSVLEFIQQQIRRRGHSPTIREIGQKFGISSTNGVRMHLTALIKKGYLKKQPLISRGLELTQSLVGEVGRLPLVGSVPAGTPIDAIENHEGEIAVDKSFLPKGDTFTLRVDGDSMKDAGIFDRDYVIVRKQQVASAGDIVVAVIGGEATVKRYFPEGKRVRLQPENDAFEAIIVDKRSGDFRIAGKVVGLMRRMD